MALEDVQVWRDTFEQQAPPTGSVIEGVQNVSNWLDERVSGVLEFSPPVFGDAKYTWQPQLFASQLLSIVPAPSSAPGALQIAMAWQNATLASVMTLQSGYVGADVPPTSWGPPPAVAILPPTVQAAGQALAAELQTLQPTGGQSEFPDALRKAFLLVAFAINGVNKIPPPAGPLPLVVPSAIVQ